MTESQAHIPRYFELRRRAIELVDSVSQTSCRYCIDPCCERRLCMRAYDKFQPVLYLEPKAEAIREAAKETRCYHSFIDSDGCMFSILRPAVCLSYYCSKSISGLLRSEQLCVLAMGRAFPDEEVTDFGELQFLEYAVEVCDAVLRRGEKLQERDKRRLISRVRGLTERLNLYVVS